MSHKNTEGVNCKNLYPEMALREEEEEQVPKVIKTSSYYSTTETSKSLPTEIIVEILLRLPVESLLRCKSVCKLWLALISDPYFVKSHLKLSTTSNYEHHRIISGTMTPATLKSFPLNDALSDKSVVNSLDHVCPSQCGLSIIGSCNGLVCIVCYNIEQDISFIWNPSTRMWSRLPCSGFVLRYEVYGFGYAESTDDYKLVAISCPWCAKYQDMNQPKVKIYSLKTGKWNQIGDFPHGYPMDISGKFSNGALHWVATPRRDNVPHYPCTIVSLDLANETYGEVLPPVYDEGCKDLTLGALGEWLCVLCYYRVNRADLWAMKVYGEKDSWTKLFSIPYLVDISSSGPLSISNNLKVLFQSGWNLIVYDLKDGLSSEFGNFDGCDDACTFVESLVSPYPPSGLDNNN